MHDSQAESVHFCNIQLNISVNMYYLHRAFQPVVVPGHIWPQTGLTGCIVTKDKIILPKSPQWKCQKSTFQCQMKKSVKYLWCFVMSGPSIPWLNSTHNVEKTSLVVFIFTDKSLALTWKWSQSQDSCSWIVSCLSPSGRGKNPHLLLVVGYTR